MADYLLKKGYNSITLLDVSETAINTIQQRLGKNAANIIFLTQDILKLTTSEKYDLWHDRAVFHFLTEKSDIEKYVQILAEKLNPVGFLVIATFSNNGPDMCSGLKVQQYTEIEMEKTFKKNFKKIECFTQNHTTPSGSIQNFLFCIFQKN